MLIVILTSLRTLSAIFEQFLFTLNFNIDRATPNEERGKQRATGHPSIERATYIPDNALHYIYTIPGHGRALAIRRAKRARVRALGK